MRCSSCGKEIPDDESAEFDTTNVARGSGGRSAYTDTAPVWRCHDCASYRRSTFRLLYWFVGVMLGLGILFGIIEAIS